VNKYLQIFKISFAQEFAYKANFIMWRVRNVFQIFLIFFLWDAVFSDQGRVVFGYDRTKILTYVFGVMLVRALVLSSKSVDIARDIATGELSNYLLRPISYFKYWFTRDVSSKVLNIMFAVVEFAILYLILKPPFYFQTDIFTNLSFLISVGVAILIFSTLIFIVSTVPFWAPELGWGSHFLVTVVVVESLSGSVFPIDVLPQLVQRVLMITPFPYLIYFPIQVYLGKIGGFQYLQGTLISLLWIVVLWLVLRRVWSKGLKVYQAFGR